MTRRSLLRCAVASLAEGPSALMSTGRCRLQTANGEIEVATRAVDLVRETTVVDMLGLLTVDWPRQYRWYRDPSQWTEDDFRRLEASGVSVLHPAVEPTAGEPHEAARRWLAGWNRLLSSQPCYLTRIETITQLLDIPKRGILGVLIGFQNSTHFREVDDVARFHAAGQRVSQLTYNTANRLGSGCFERTDSGLTEFGMAVVHRMNEVGMAIDISHCGERTSLDAIAYSRRPVLATHSNCGALVPGQPRCKSDEVIRALAAGGGVIGMTMVRKFVSRRPRPGIEHYLDHFDHVARLVGPEHVGIGSDIDIDAADPVTGRPLGAYAIAGLEPRLRIYQLADGLLARGHTPVDVAAMLGGNFMRTLIEVFPDASWQPTLGRRARRDPFCPAPKKALLPSGCVGGEPDAEPER